MRAVVVAVGRGRSDRRPAAMAAWRTGSGWCRSRAQGTSSRWRAATWRCPDADPWGPAARTPSRPRGGPAPIRIYVYA